MFLTLLVFFLVLSILVLIHEIGHFVAAKRFGIKVEEFGFGLPPRLFAKKIGETEYSINALPIGGFVKLYGEEGPADAHAMAGEGGIDSTNNRSFYNRPPWQRAIVLIAGVAMNFLLALVVLSFLFTQGVFVPAQRVHIEKVVDDSPAMVAGLHANDIILSMDETKILTNDDLVNYTKERLGQSVRLTILRGANFEKPIREGECIGCETLTLSVVPRKDAPQGQGPIGIAISHYEQRIYTWYEAPIYGTKEALFLSRELLIGLGKTVWKLVTFQSVSREVAGPIGIAQATGQAVKFGNMAVLELLGLLSLNLAIINILPFPALDGGRLLFVIIEATTGKRIHTHWERNLHQIGMAILLALILLVTINDILRIFGKV